MKQFIVLMFIFCLLTTFVQSSVQDDPEINGVPMSKWIAQLEDMNRGNQVRAARALAEAPPEYHKMLVPKLIPLLSAQRENTRPWAAMALGNYGPVAREAVPHLIPLLHDEQYERNRAAAAKALGQILKGAEPSEEVEKVVNELIRLFDDQYLDVRREAVRACGMIGLAAKACIPHLAKRIKDAAGGSSLIRSVGKEAVWTCGQFGPLAACHIDLLISVMHGGPVPETIEAIGKIGAVNDNVVPNIVDRMEQVASGTVHVQEGSRTPPMSGELIRANMQKGFEALARFGPKSAPAIPYLTRIVSGVDKQPKDYVLGALGVLKAIGAPASSAVPAIEKCLQSKDADIKKAAEEALTAIRSGGQGGAAPAK
jgi:HEAT repeat protein